MRRTKASQHRRTPKEGRKQERNTHPPTSAVSDATSLAIWRPTAARIGGNLRRDRRKRYRAPAVGVAFLETTSGTTQGTADQQLFQEPRPQQKRLFAYFPPLRRLETPTRNTHSLPQLRAQTFGPTGRISRKGRPKRRAPLNSTSFCSAAWRAEARWNSKSARSGGA